MSQGFQARLGIDTVQPVARGFDFQSVGLALSQSIIDTSGLRGTREHFSYRTRAGNISVAGQYVGNPSADDLAYLLPWILGAPGSGGTYALAETLPSRYVTIDKVSSVYTYHGVYVSRATFSGAEGMPVGLALDLVGTSETAAAAGTFPTVTYNDSPPLMFSESVVTILGGSRNVKQWTLVIDNQLDVLYFNSVTPTLILPKDRQISFECQNPFTADELDLYNQNPAGAAASLSLSYAQQSVTFNFGVLQVPPQAPGVPGRQEIYLPLRGIARNSGSAPSLSVSLVTS